MFQSLLLSLSLLAAGPAALAQAPGAAPTVVQEKPLSLSYVNVIKCFPELKNDAWSMKVDLNELKEQADRKFVTSQTLLRYRQTRLKDLAGAQKRLRLSAMPATKKGKVSYQLTVEKLDSHGSGSPVDIPSAHRLNPTQKILDLYFLNQEVLEDEYSYFDTKLNNMNMSYKRNFKQIFELEISDPRGRRKLFCEDKKDLGPLCTCSFTSSSK